ncbi:S1 family peptidase [Streptomyces sp. enrichment culture]|uniref:S1 family peptidase n=1 Tax=Streptomyces sp. enrichment culture TaxID=1795815 RepID=UPI003F553A63
MSHKRIPKRKAAAAVGAVVALGAAAILLPSAGASQDGVPDDVAAAPRTLRAGDASDLATRLAGMLGDAYAGAWYDGEDKRLVVNVVRGEGVMALKARSAGAEVREVDHSMAELEAGARTLKTEATIPGTSWAVDPRTNKILVTADSTVTGDTWDRLESTVEGLGSGMATLKRSAGTFRTFASGGDAIFAGGARCSLGFNVTAGDGSPAFLTAGHCVAAGDEWSDRQGGEPIATVGQALFPGAGDFALLAYDDPAVEAPSEVNVGGRTVPVVRAADATVGQQVFRMGSTTGLADGQVLGLDATVNYPEGTVTGLIQTDVCAEPGDSGGPLFTQDGLALGLTSGGSGDCTVGGETFFQPVTTALEAVGATLGADADAGADGQAGGQAQGAGEETGDGQAGADGRADAGDRTGGQDAGAGQDGAGGHHGAPEQNGTGSGRHSGAGSGTDSGPAPSH